MLYSHGAFHGGFKIYLKSRLLKRKETEVGEVSSVWWFTPQLAQIARAPPIQSWELPPGLPVQGA